MFSMKSFFLKSLPMFFFAGEGGAQGGSGEGAAAATADPPAAPAVPDNGVPKEFMDSYIENDPEYQELLRLEQAEKDKAATADKDKKSSEDKSDKTGDDEENTDAGKKGSGDDKDDSTPKTEGDEKNTAGEEDEDFDFADDVIQGLKGDHLKAIPKEGKLALAEFYSKNAELLEEHKALKERLEKVSADPVWKLREDLIKKGQTQFNVRGLTVEEKNSLIANLQAKTGLTPEEAEAVFSEVEDTIKSVSAKQAEDILNNRVIEDEERRRTDEVMSNGRNIFLKLGQFNKELQFKETDGNKFWMKDSSGKWVPNESHPESKKFLEKIVPIVESLGNAGIKYGTLINLEKEIGIDGIYAMLAKKHGLPVAINTQERDNKMLQSELRKRLAPFIKGKADELSPDKGKSKPTHPSHIKDGYDITKLVTDEAYYDRALNAKPGNVEHAQKVARLATEGEAYIKKHSNK